MSVIYEGVNVKLSTVKAKEVERRKSLLLTRINLIEIIPITVKVLLYIF